MPTTLNLVESGNSLTQFHTPPVAPTFSVLDGAIHGVGGSERALMESVVDDYTSVGADQTWRMSGGQGGVLLLGSDGHGYYFGRYGGQAVLRGITAGDARAATTLDVLLAGAGSIAFGDDNVWWRIRQIEPETIEFATAPSATGEWRPLSNRVYTYDIGYVTDYAATFGLFVDAGQSVAFDKFNTSDGVALTPAAHAVEVTQGDAGTSSVTSTISNATGATSVASVSGAQASHVSASISGATLTSVVDRAAFGALDPDEYVVTVTVTDGTTTATDTITVTVQAASVIDVDTTPVAFTATFGGAAPATITRDVDSGGGGTLTGLDATVLWSGDEPEDWLAATIETVDGQQRLVLTPSLAGLAARTYSAAVTLTAPGADDVTILVTLGVRPVDATEVVHLVPDADDLPFLPASNVQYRVEPAGIVNVETALTLRAITPVTEPTEVTLTVTIDGESTESTFTVYPHGS